MKLTNLSENKALCRRKLITLLSRWHKKIPNRKNYAMLIGLTSTKQLKRLFTDTELMEIEASALDIKKQSSANQRSMMYQALYFKGLTGDVNAIREFLNRTEGKVPDVIFKQKAVSIVIRHKKNKDGSREVLSEKVPYAIETQEDKKTPQPLTPKEIRQEITERMYSEDPKLLAARDQAILNDNQLDTVVKGEQRKQEVAEIIEKHAPGSGLSKAIDEFAGGNLEVEFE